MGLSTQLEFIRSFLLRLHSLTRRKRRTHGGKHTVGCVGRLRIPAVSTFRREELSDFGSDSGRKRQRSRRRKKKKKLRFGFSFGNEVFVRPDAIPSEQEEFDNFTATHPGYLDTLVVDELREEEYGELQEEGHVCLDYSGYGLFSQLQQELDADSSSFAISYVSGDLSTQALYGEPEEGTVEYDIRRRIIRFLNIQEGEYSMVFTASKGSAFKILGESYPFNSDKSLLTVFDYESEAVCSLKEIAKRQGAQIMNASFNFPSFTVCSSELKSQILHGSGLSDQKTRKDAAADQSKKQSWEDRWIKKKTADKGLLAETKKEEEEDEAKGLFVFPVQSRITGTKYSYQWMSMAQDNGWHVLLDASALGPKDMDCLGLSLFRPDFIVTSFYKVFGSDPTGFGCLFVKNSTIDILRPSPEARSIGMVRLVADNSAFESESGNHIVVNGSEKHVQESVKDFSQLKQGPRHAEVAFSGPISATWKTRPYCNRMESCLENIESSPESPTAADADQEVTRSAGGDAYKSNSNQDADVNGACLTKGKMQITLNGDQDKSIPLTPRSVLEETLIMDGQDQSMSHGSSSRTKPSLLHSFEVGETSSKESVFSEWDSNPLLPIHKPQKGVEKKKLLAYYSQEITSQADPWKNAATAFSQPLGIQRNMSLAHSEGSSYYVGSHGDDLDFSSSLYDDEDEDDDDHSSDFDFEDDASIVRREPEIYCRGLNHADTLGLNKTNDRLKFLINWLISSMLKLQHLVSNKYVDLVHVYGPKVKYDRGASLAFNLFDQSGIMINPVLVQQLALRHNISIGTGVLAHIQSPGNCAELQQNPEEDQIIDPHSDSAPLRFRVATAALGFFTNFEDVYKLWAFVAKFLDTEFLRQESQTLNQPEAGLDCKNPA